jgi:uncharacterized protein (TIGR02466 family)
MKIDTVSMAREVYFPTLVYSFQQADPEALNTRLLELIYGEQERDQAGIQRSNFRALGGWHSHNDLHKNPEYAELVDSILTAGKLVSDDLGYHKGYSLRIGTMWSIINPPGSANRAHIHPGCTWSGVYYIQTPEGCGNIEFIDPRTENLMQQPRYMPNKKRPKHCWTKANITPRPGRMLIFPSWLYHAVAPNLSEEPDRAGQRVIISFNLSQQKN